MKHTSAATIAMITSFLLCSPGALAQEKSLKQQIVGTWELTNWEQVYPDGHKDQAFGKEPKGVNWFDADGHFALMFINPELPKVSSGDRVRPTPEEAMAIAKGVIAYYGTYTVDEASKSINMQLNATSFVNQMAQGGQKRVVDKISATEMTYHNLNSVSGGKIEYGFKRLN